MATRRTQSSRRILDQQVSESQLQRDVQHDNGCPVTQARAFLAAHPATAAAAESEGE